jgi:hypothetical protein
MEAKERKQKIQFAYNAIAKTGMHKEYKERLKFLRGWTSREISAKLRKVAAYIVDYPDANLAEVYAGAFGLGYHGSVPNDVTE